MKVSIIAALTADGFIGRTSDHLADWTSKEDKQLFISLTKEAGVMIMGSRTYDTIGRPLPGRKTVIYTNHPEKYTDPALVATNDSPQSVLDALQKDGYNNVAICGGAQIYDLFLQAGVVTDLHLTIAPLLFGSGVPLFKKETAAKMSLQSHKLLDENSLALHYKILA